MTRPLLTPLFLALTLSGLAGCGDSKPAASGNISMRDMEVVDGTANDSMADLDNATDDGTLLSNGGALPPMGTESPPMGNGSAADIRKTAPGEPTGNTSAATP